MRSLAHIPTGPGPEINVHRPMQTTTITVGDNTEFDKPEDYHDKQERLRKEAAARRDKKRAKLRAIIEGRKEWGEDW